LKYIFDYAAFVPGALGLVFSLILSGPVELLHTRGVVCCSASAAILLLIVLGGGSEHRASAATTPVSNELACLNRKLMVTEFEEMRP
jgi:hypothetical protein